MEEINLKELFSYFLTKFRLILVVTIIAVLIGSIYSLVFVEEEYEATTTLILTGIAEASGSNTNIDGVAISQNDVNLNSKLVATYREIIKSKTVLKDVINTLDLDCTVAALRSQITVATVTGTEMISITVKTREAENAYKIANELADKFSEQIKKTYKIENISIIDKAELNPMPVNMSILKQVIIYALIGIVLGSAIVFVMFYFDTTVKDEEQLERLGLVVLTSIPEKVEKGGKTK